MSDEANKAALERIAQNTYNLTTTAGQQQKTADEDRVKHFGKRELEKVKEPETVAHIITEGQLKIINDSDKFTDQQKESTRVRFQEENPNSPLVKGQNIVINELRTLNRSLNGIHLRSLAVDRHTSVGATINATTVNNDMRKGIQDSINQVNSDIKAARPGASTLNMQADLAQLRNAMKSLDKLDEERKKVTPNQRVGRTNPGEFVVR